MIVCLRKVKVPPEERERFLGWIEENRELRESRGILLELVLDRPNARTPRRPSNVLTQKAPKTAR